MYQLQTVTININRDSYSFNTFIKMLIATGFPGSWIFKVMLNPWQFHKVSQSIQWIAIVRLFLWHCNLFKTANMPSWTYAFIKQIELYSLSSETNCIKLDFPFICSILSKHLNTNYYLDILSECIPQRQCQVRKLSFQFTLHFTAVFRNRKIGKGIYARVLFRRAGSA